MIDIRKIVAASIGRDGAIARRRLQAFEKGIERPLNSGLYKCVESDGQYLIETRDGRVMIVVNPGKGV